MTTLLTGLLLSGACASPARAIRPVIYANYDEAAVAMRTAPVILLVRIADVTLTGDERDVAKPAGVGGPHAPTVPLELARIKADVLFTVHGSAQATIEFYSWIWASGQHGGPRLFHPNPGGIRAIFLRYEGGYLRTVGDYPSYDLELSSGILPALLTAWKSGQMRGADELERFVALRLRAELEQVTEEQLCEDFGNDGPRVNHHWVTDMYDLVRVVGPYFAATQVDDICLHAKNPFGRFAACFVAAQNFPGRCEAYQIARKATPNEFRAEFLAKAFASCKASARYRIDALVSGEESRLGFYWASLVPPQHRRETLRVYASSMDLEIRRAACAVAATAVETRDILECLDFAKSAAPV